MAGGESTVITDAPSPASQDASRRTKRYLILMGVRVVCIMGAFLIPGWPKWIVILAAAILPGVAVLLANQPNQKKLLATDADSPSEDSGAAALTDGSYDVVPGEVINRRSPTSADPAAETSDRRSHDPPS